MANLRASAFEGQLATVEDTSKPAVSRGDLGNFASLQPLNSAAKLAFNATVKKILGNGSIYARLGSFMHGQRTDERQRSPQSDDEVSEPQPQSPSIEYSGFFKLSLTNLPREPFEGWRLGCQGPEGETPADFLLCPRKHRCKTDKCANEVCKSDHCKKRHCIDVPCMDPCCDEDHCKSWQCQSQGIAPNHALLRFHESLSSIVLIPRHSVIVTQPEGKVLSGSKPHILKHGEVIMIGYCSYMFQLRQRFVSPSFQGMLEKFRKFQYGPSFFMNKALTPCSVATPIRIGDFNASPMTFIGGTYGSVTSAWKEDGDKVFAVKRFKHSNPPQMSAHVEIMKDVGVHDHVLTLVASYYNLKQIQGTFAIYSPFVAASLAQVVMGNFHIDTSLKLILFCDILDGLTWLHEKGIMHRDLKPDNLGILDMNKPIGYILDLDHLTKETESYDHKRGTIVFSAPEILALKDWESETSSKKPLPPPYGKEVDIFALGLTMYGMYHDCHFMWQRFEDPETRVPPRNSLSDKLHERFQFQLDGDLQKVAQNPSARMILQLVKRMTGYTPAARSQARELLNTARAASGDLERGVIVPRPVDAGKIEGKRAGEEIDLSQTKAKRPRRREEET